MHTSCHHTLLLALLIIIEVQIYFCELEPIVAQHYYVDDLDALMCLYRIHRMKEEMERVSSVPPLPASPLLHIQDGVKHLVITTSPGITAPSSDVYL